VIKELIMISKTLFFTTLFFVILLFVLTGCNSTVVHEERLPLEIPQAPELKMRPVNWEIYDSKICLEPTEYSNLSLNTEDIKGFIQYQNKVLEMYKNYYKNDSKTDK